MNKYRIAFKYIASGDIEIEANDVEEAENLAETKLEELRSLGDLLNNDEIMFSDDEVEV